jgi:bacterial/archaeal transporter family-2 protein
MQWWPAGFALFAAALLPVQAALNGALNRAFDRPALVVLVSLTGSALFIGAVGLATGRLGLVPAARLANVPWWAWPGGVCGAIYLLSQPLVAPRLGAAAYISLSVAAQIVAAVLLDHFGALGLPQHAASPLRIVGALLMAAGVVMVARY